ncbi:hypothetical protein BTA51_10120 [Hahella sp. CCB-MM4]|uniref:hypothetical protein n=1 Tax=Hahella sp. (strain CCB-MM4) TaxID=1926491 RepID=UPI000B9ADF24|nr:hypothetical protein [Hahella sp. CCB-MM4]OZG73375.1 hypothetical protein BTA51_10120 [Hahella sp. CCB-MM4]
MLRQQEILAIKLVFRNESEISTAIRERINEAVSIDWEETRVGFFSTIKLKSPLTELPSIHMWEFNFSHPDFPHGGSYMCTIVSDTELELEAVSLGGADWPYPENPELFKEL